MKNRYYFILAMLLVSACQKPAETTTASVDSLQSADTTHSADEGTGDGYEGESELPDVDGNLLSEKYQKTNAEMQLRNGALYEVSASTNNYESMSTSTWYFDSTFSVVYYSNSWSMEGQEGAGEFFLADDKVICYSSEESGGTTFTSVKVCETVGGTKVTEEEGQENPTEEMISDTYLEGARQELEGDLSRLISFLKESKITEKGDETYTIRVESILNVGFDVTESSEVSIPRVLYEKLVRE